MVEPFSDQQDFRAAEEKVLHPQTHIADVPFGKDPSGRPRTLRLTPMPERALRALAKRIMDAMLKFKKAHQDLGDIDFDAIGDAMVDGCALVAAHHQVQGVTRDWIADNLQDSEMFDVLEAQLQIQDQNSFLRNGALRLLRALKATAIELGETTDGPTTQAATAHEEPSPSSTGPSAKPGE